jgi:hypothetical protein
MDVIEHYLSKCVFREFPNKLKDLLLEASTSGASDAEAAICVAYNMKKGKSESDAVKAAVVDESVWKRIKKKKAIVAAGKNVADDLKDVGSVLVWSGKSSAKTHYEKGSNKTAKTDLFGNKRNRISLKKASSSAKGAQLMSAYVGESAGVFSFAMKHLEATKGSAVSKSDMQSIFDMLEKEMASTARNDINVEVGSGKRDFKNWVINDSGRYEEVKNQATESSKDEIERHIKAELAVANAISSADAPKLEEDFIDGVKPLTAKDIESMRAKYVASDMKIGNVKISQDYLDKANVADELLTKGALREQIMDIIDVALKADGWKNRLTEILQNNSDLKRWIVYEAASGLGKFTGKAVGGGDYFGGIEAVANKILVFDKNGLKKMHGVYKWSGKNAGLCDNVDISYKGSGRRRYIKFGLASEQKTTASLDDPINFYGIVDEEYEKLETELKSLALNEGVVWDTLKGGFDSAKSWVINSYEKIKTLVTDFYEGVIKKFFLGLWDLFQKGLSAVLDAFGYVLDGTCSIATPVW